MRKKIIVNPVTRISGFMQIEVIVENKRIIDAKTEGLMFRGFEEMLRGRAPFDAVYFTQRICGICSTAHSIASSLALEDALNIVPLEQGRYLRDILHCAEYLQNHLRHFYQYTIPDFVKLPNKYPLLRTEHSDFRLPKDINDKIASDYFASLEFSRSAHEMLAVLGGKAPHNHGVFIGGISTQATTDKIIKIKSILTSIKSFIEDIMIPDVYLIAKYYNDYFDMGKGYGNLLSYGCFNNYQQLGTLYLEPSVYTKSANEIERLNPDFIDEEIDFAWYKEVGSEDREHIPVTKPDMTKPNAYSFIKAPRYKNMPFETGPLARQWLCGEYRNGISMMDRTIARVLEAKKIVSIMFTLLENLIPNVDVQSKYSIPNQAKGKGLVDTIRGALGHWLTIENNVISNYQIITPSAWNLSTQGDKFKGTGERALIGTYIKNENDPVEIGRIIRSFDPCISCATHVFMDNKSEKTIIINH